MPCIDALINQVLTLTLKLQQQRDVPLWAVANNNVIYSIAVGETIRRGPRQTCLYHVMKIAQRIKCSDVILVLVGLFGIIRIVYGFKKQPKQINDAISRVFACCGCLSDDYLFNHYKNRAGSAPLKINWITHEGLASLKLPVVHVMLFQLMKQAFGHTKKLSNAQSEVSAHITDFLVIGAINLGQYVFYRAYWELASTMGINELAILVPSVPAIAAIDANLKTIFLQHGLLELGVVMPKFHRIESLTLDEVSYFRQTLPHVPIYKCSAQQRGDSSNKNNNVLWLSVNFCNELLHEHQDMWLIVDQWAKKTGLQVIIRPTPKVTAHALLDLQQKFPDAIFDDLNDALELSLEKWNPKFVIAWRSTGLATALEYGCLPIMLHSHEACLSTWNLIYPMRKRVLFWNRDAEKINDAAICSKKYQENIKQLSQYEVL